MANSGRVLLCALVSVVLFSSLGVAVTPDRIAGVVSGPTVALPGNVHRRALPKYDQGPADPSLRFGSLTLLTTPTASQIKALKQLLVQQQDPKSPNYHKWLTPEQWADRFGLTPADVQKITQWLKSQGFTVGSVALGRNWITFSGTAAQIRSAFGTEIHRYNVNGEMHVANATAPKIPFALSGIVTGIRGMHDFHLRPATLHRNFVARPLYSSQHFGDLAAAGDVATIYDINALYNGSPVIDGTGEKLAVIGQTDIFLSDITNYRTGFGLSAISCTTTTTGTVGIISACSDPHLQYVYVNDQTGIADPLTPTAGDLSEADLDLELAGAVARNAQLIYVNAPTASVGGVIQGGVWDAWYWAVDHNLAPVITMSYGLCEFDDNQITVAGSGVPSNDELELQKANSLGISFMNSTGDFGAAECDSSSSLQTGTGLATLGAGVGYPASSPEVTGVGGSAIAMADLGSGANAATYWGTTNGTDGGTALSYIPELGWNDADEIGQFCAQNPTNTFCMQGGTTAQTGWTPITSQATAQADIGPSSSGGGPSNCAIQDSTNMICVGGFPQPSWQSAAISDQSSARFSPDVSLMASPNFPGYIFCTQLSELGVSGSGSACLNGGPAGIQNAVSLSNGTVGSIIGGTSASSPLFAGMVTLLNQYLNGANSPGLGNINPTLYALAENPSNGAFHPITGSNNQIYCVPGSPSMMPSNVTCPGNGVIGFLGTDADPISSYNLVTGLGSVDADKLLVAWKAYTTQAGFTLSPSTAALTAAAGSGSNSTTITVTPMNGFAGAVNFACQSPVPTGTTCQFASVTSTSETLTIQTTSGMQGVQNASVVVTGTSGSVSSSTVVNLTVTGGTQSFKLLSSISGGTISLNPGNQAAVNLSISSSTGFVVTSGGNSQTAVPVTYNCTGLPTGAQCLFSPSNQTQATSVSLNLTTSAASAKLSRPFDRGSRIFLASLLPGIFGVVFTFGNRRRSLRSLRFLGLLLVLGCSTLWLASCGGSNGGGGGGSTGTPPGSYPITVNATTSSGPSSSVNFTLSVQ